VASSGSTGRACDLDIRGNVVEVRCAGGVPAATGFLPTSEWVSRQLLGAQALLAPHVLNRTVVVVGVAPEQILRLVVPSGPCAQRPGLRDVRTGPLADPGEVREQQPRGTHRVVAGSGSDNERELGCTSVASSRACLSMLLSVVMSPSHFGAERPLTGLG
jgi:hypothetical protein